MTKEQKEKALAFLKDMQECTYDGVEEIRTAIEALEQEPCEDTISRQAVLNTLFYNSDNNCEVVLNKELQDRIKALPHVTPARMKGKWIPRKAKYDNAVPVYECSICHKNNGFDDDNFCPNCGAEMEIEE